MTSYNVAVIGIAGVGKTTYINRLRGMPFSALYRAGWGRHDATVEFSTNLGPIRITFNDYDGSTILRKSTDYIENTDGVIYMFDVTSPLSLRKLTSLHMGFDRKLPALLIANKIDCRRRLIGEPIHPMGVDYAEISSKLSGDHKAPILKLLKTLTGNEDLEFV